VVTASEDPQGEKTAGFPFPIQAGENVIQVCRRHWLYLWPSVGLQALFAVVPLIVAAFLLSAVGLDGIVATVVWAVLAAHAAYRALLAFLTWYRYHNDIWVITNQRIIDSYKKHPFNLRIATTDLVNVQDMSVERDGMLRTMLDYGDIVCQTASEMQDFRLAGIPNPVAVQALVDRERDRERLKSG
jgi:hypothetical protein